MTVSTVEDTSHLPRGGAVVATTGRLAASTGALSMVVRPEAQRGNVVRAVRADDIRRGPRWIRSVSPEAAMQQVVLGSGKWAKASGAAGGGSFAMRHAVAEVPPKALDVPLIHSRKEEGEKSEPRDAV